MSDGRAERTNEAYAAGLSVAGCVHRVHWVQVGAWSRDACRQIRLQASRLHAPTCTQCTRCTQPATDRRGATANTRCYTAIDGALPSVGARDDRPHDSAAARSPLDAGRQPRLGVNTPLAFGSVVGKRALLGPASVTTVK